MMHARMETHNDLPARPRDEERHSRRPNAGRAQALRHPYPLTTVRTGRLHDGVSSRG